MREKTAQETIRTASGARTAAPRPKPGESVVTYLGHATTLIDIDGVRLLTDPILRTRVGVLRRQSPVPGAEAIAGLHAILLSHFHLDHTDLVSMSMLPARTTVIAPAGARSVLRSRRFEDIREVSAGDSVTFGPVQITATPAKHENRRFPWSRRSEALGYLVQGSSKVYFAGDTGLFPELEQLPSDLDLALLPIWGWGLRLRDDHLSPETAAKALQLLRPRYAIPIHWGTLLPMGVARRYAHYLVDPPGAFVRHAQTLAPDVECVVLKPGEWARI